MGGTRRFRTLAEVGFRFNSTPIADLRCDEHISVTCQEPIFAILRQTPRP